MSVTFKGKCKLNQFKGALANLGPGLLPCVLQTSACSDTPDPNEDLVIRLLSELDNEASFESGVLEHRHMQGMLNDECEDVLTRVQTNQHACTE